MYVIFLAVLFTVKAMGGNTELTESTLMSLAWKVSREEVYFNTYFRSYPSCGKYMKIWNAQIHVFCM